MDYLQNHIEALIFCSTHAISIEEIHLCLNEMLDSDIDIDDINASTMVLLNKYENDIYPFKIEKLANGYQFLTKPAYQVGISILLKQKSKKRLSPSSMETLAVIAYKQPITKTSLEQIRGVNCDHAVQKLLEKDLVEIIGKSDSVGRPLLYGTSPKFMEYFGINSIKDLPQPKDIAEVVNQIGEELE